MALMCSMMIDHNIFSIICPSIEAWFGALVTRVWSMTFNSSYYQFIPFSIKRTYVVERRLGFPNSHALRLEHILPYVVIVGDFS